MFASLVRSEAFVPYAVTCLLLVLNLVVLWSWSGIVRVRVGKVLNAEDAARIAKTAQVVDVDPPEIARALRAYHNAAAAIVPFLLAAQIWIELGAEVSTASVLCGMFVLFRYAHSIAYLRGIQPARTVAFFAGQLILVIVVVLAAVRLASHARG